MFKNIQLTIAFAMISCAFFAQNNTASFYSSYAIGEHNEALTISQRSMGGIKNLDIDDNISLYNPSLGASISETSYQLGVSASTLNIQTEQDSYRNGFANLAYLSIGIPVTKKASLSFGLLPFSAVNYENRAQSFEADGTTLKETSTFKGEGGTNKLFLSGGFEPIEGLKIGIQAGYLFGNIENNITTQAEDDGELLARYEHQNTVRGFSWITGGHYTRNVHEKYTLKTGFSIEHSNKLDGNVNEYLYSISASQVAKDTILDTKSSGSLKIPTTFSASVGVGEKEKWFVGADFTTREKLTIDDVFYNSNTNEAYANYEKWSIGGFFKPKQKGLSKFWKKTTYRIGASIANTGLLIDIDQDGLNFEEIKDKSLTLGFGLPIGKETSKLDLGFEIGQRGTTSNGLLQENYFNMMLGISLSDQWFKKQEIF